MMISKKEKATWSIRGLSETEYQTLYFALGEYAKNLTKTLSEPNAGAEDREFCGGELKVIGRMEQEFINYNRLIGDTSF